MTWFVVAGVAVVGIGIAGVVVIGDRSRVPEPERAATVAFEESDVASRRSVRGIGIAMLIPSSWRGDVFSTAEEIGGLPSVTHVTSFPTDLRDYEVGASSASAAMRADDVRIVLLEFPVAQAGQEGFRAASLPVQVGPADAETHGGHSVIKRRTVLSGRPFSITIEFGQRQVPPDDVRVVNDVLRTLTVEPDELTDPALWKKLRRPLRVQKLAVGAPCPTAKTGRSGPLVGVTLGSGPAYPSIGSSSATATLRHDLRQRGWYLHKTLWAASPTYAGPLLIRGSRLDAPGTLRFGRRRSTELRLPGSSGDWRYFPTFTVIPSPGCYAFHVDGMSFTRVIVFATA